MAIFAILHLWSFPWKPYAIGFQTDEITDMYGNGKRTYQGGRLGMGALLDALNPVDLVRAVGRSLRWLFVGRKKRTLDPSYQPPTEAISLNQTENTAPIDTGYGGAGALMAGGASRYGRQQDEEGEVLLSHAQPDPSSGDLGVAPPPYYEADQRYYLAPNRSDDHYADSDLHSHSSRPISPFEEVHYDPSRSPSESDGNYYHAARHSSSHARFPSSTELQEQPPIPMPDPYQPSDIRSDSHGRR